MENLKVKTVKNIGFNAFANIAKFVLAGIASIILAQNLSASDYGIVGFATIFINFLARFSDLGISEAVIQKKQLDDRGLYTGYTTKFIMGITIFSAAFFLSPVAKLFFDHASISLVIKVLSLNFIISTFSFLPVCLLKRELNYRKLIIPQITAAFTSSGMSIVLALAGFGYWSIVIANMSSSLVNVLLLYLVRPIKIRFHFNRELFQEFIGFGSKLFFSGVIIYLIFNADNFIVGTVMGSTALGLYAIAFNWGSMISGRLQEVVHSVLFPTYSRIQDDKLRLKSSYLRILEYVVFIGTVSNVTLLLCSKEFLYYVLGRGTDKWMPALTTFNIMLIYGIIRTFLEPVGNVLMALGKSNILLKSTLIAGTIEIVLLYPVAKAYGIEGVALLVTLAYSVQYFIYFPFLKKEIDLNYADIWNIGKPAALTTAFIAGVVLLMPGFTDKSLYSLAAKFALSVTGYILFYSAITKWKLVKDTVGIIRSMRTS
jgi:O-antigen/teichoic acid export membrane protein